MSGLAKTFVILILLLSVFFFGTTATLYKTRAQWRAKHDSYKAHTSETVKDLDRRLTQTTKSSDEKDKALAQLKGSNLQQASSLKKTQSDLSTLQKKVAGLEGDLRNATATSEQLAQAVSSSEDRGKGLQGSLATANSQLDEALQNLDMANKERDSMKLSLVRAQQQIHDGRTEHQLLAEQAAECRIQVVAYAAKYGDSPGVTNAPDVDALVSAVDAGENLAVISAGREQLVQVGHVFTVQRGDSFIGKLEVIKVYPDLAGARIVWTADGQDVRQGDKVFTSTN